MKLILGVFSGFHMGMYFEHFMAPFLRFLAPKILWNYRLYADSAIFESTYFLRNS